VPYFIGRQLARRIASCLALLCEAKPSEKKFLTEDTMGQIAWITDMNDALSRAKAEKKPILLDFFNPG
jgi:hypothetical protein